MNENQRKTSSIGKDVFELSRWYYVFVSILVILSLVTLNRTATGEWEIILGIQEMTAILATLALLPALLRFFKGYEKGALKLFGLEFSWERKTEIDERVTKIQKEHAKAGEAAKSTSQDLEKIRTISQEADNQLFSAIEPGELPILQRLYLQELHDLIQNFNRNQHLFSFGKPAPRSEADEIAFKMRTIVPWLFGQFEIERWLQSSNPGKRLAAIKHIDWAQDIEFVESLLEGLIKENALMQYHIWLALLSMVDQFTEEHRKLLQSRLEDYHPPSGSARKYWKQQILDTLS